MSLPQREYGAKKYSEILKEGLQYIKDRKSGKIKSFRTPWNGLNNAGVGGLEWGAMLTIAARPGAGKTMLVSHIIRESKVLNPTQDFNVLEFQFEMAPKQTASRDFAALTALDYDVVLSTRQAVDDYSVEMMDRYVKETERLEGQGVHRLQINKPLTHRDMEKAIHHYYNAMGSKPMIVTIDHSWLMKKDAGDKEKINTLYNTVEMLMQVKNDLPIIVLMISQLNRDIEDPGRKTPGSIQNYPTSSDIFGGDALMQGSDMVLVLTRPFRSEIRSYGPKQFQTTKEDIFGHILKSRNGSDDDNIIYMKGDFKKQSMIENPPPTASNPSGVTVARSRSRFQSTDADINI